MQRWRDHGFDLEFGNLGYDGDRNDVESYLAGLGWRSVRTPLMQLLAANGLRGMPETGDRPAFADNYYCSSILHR